MYEPSTGTLSSMDTLEDWVRRTTGGKSHREIAMDLGVNHGVVSRWIRERSFPMPYLLAFARHYRVNFFEALCVLDLISMDELTAWTPLSSVRNASEVTLVTELHRRITVRDAMEDHPAPVFAPETKSATA